MSIDVEGAEDKICETIDFSKIKVKVLLYEVDGSDPHKVCRSACLQTNT